MHLSGVVGASSLIASLVPHLALVCMVVLAAFYFSFAWLTEVDEKADAAAGGAPAQSETKVRPRVVAGKDASAGRE